jgi:hypothetical protein
MNRYGPDQPCQRTACAGRETHLAGRHLDPRDELYDGPHSTLTVLPLSVRESARRIVREAPALMPEVIDMAQEIERLRRQVAHVQVDRDHLVRDAMARSESCEHHGQEIAELGRQLRAADQSARAEEAGRVALLGFLQVVQDFVDAYRAGRGPADLTVTQVVDALDKAIKKAEAAHMRAWKR